MTIRAKILKIMALVMEFTGNPVFKAHTFCFCGSEFEPEFMEITVVIKHGRQEVFRANFDGMNETDGYMSYEQIVETMSRLLTKSTSGRR